MKLVFRFYVLEDGSRFAIEAEPDKKIGDTICFGGYDDLEKGELMKGLRNEKGALYDVVKEDYASGPPQRSVKVFHKKIIGFC